jgi:hypothetical protein
VSQQIWVATLAIRAAMLVVIAVLLMRILIVVRRIPASVWTIWGMGLAVAANTTQLPLLDTTNHLFAEVLAETKHLVATTATSDRRRPER